MLHWFLLYNSVSQGHIHLSPPSKPLSHHSLIPLLQVITGHQAELPVGIQLLPTSYLVYTLQGMYVNATLQFLDPVQIHSLQFNSVAQSCPTVCNPMNHSTPGLPQQLSNKQHSIVNCRHHAVHYFPRIFYNWKSLCFWPASPIPPTPYEGQ